MGLETTVDALTSKNKVLSSENIEMKSKVQSLEEQISYLKSVILNQSSLSSLLSNMKGVETVKLSSDFSGSVDAGVSGGICLHTNGKNASIELCLECSKKAN